MGRSTWHWWKRPAVSTRPFARSRGGRSFGAPRRLLSTRERDSRSDEPVQRTATSREGVHAFADRGIGLQGRGVVRLYPGVDHERAGASPVLAMGELAGTIDVARRVG